MHPKRTVTVYYQTSPELVIQLKILSSSEHLKAVDKFADTDDGSLQCSKSIISRAAT